MTVSFNICDQTQGLGLYDVFYFLLSLRETILSTPKVFISAIYLNYHFISLTYCILSAMMESINQRSWLR
jgi:hypothetical protein